MFLLFVTPAAARSSGIDRTSRSASTDDRTAASDTSDSAIPKIDFEARTTLEYHEVKEAADESLPPGTFVSTGHIRRLATGYTESSYLITFDDGYRSVFDLVLPILQAHRVPAVAAIINEATRDSGSPDALGNHLSRAELSALVAAGWNLAFHANTSAEHELNYRRLCLALRTGSVYGGRGNSDPVDVFDDRAAAYLADNTGSTGEDTMRLLDDLRAARGAVLAKMADGTDQDTAAIAVLEGRLRASRSRLAELAGIPVEQVDTFIYPHSENDSFVRAAARRAGFVRAYGGGPIGDANDSFNKPRRWMNDTSPLP